ncbi:T9SS type B sorting domain-containing protein [Croceimicrobium hydrocarbonivorans]|uniref:Gliding motility-associated C-terminal domain-containing protein n=1 Tax=Croceimicrobium hydrocarbonivorans TaxID=2761580 RepID=A0A7H0VG84_9FLAO|nr:gliding motility-associated C-terminal domain-containing protein [Croceimicrobium hydrocarbonivorans]QNR24732.1 gliding motility-associated C-terminal domain-containing protein [Croceimicrobium hydrocarbonivorans]
MKKLTLLFLTLLSGSLFAQNLVRNGSLENTGNCPITDTVFSNYVNPWTFYKGDPDFYHPCGFPGSDSATNNALPFDGDGFAGIDVYGLEGVNYNREYLHGELKKPLEEGKFYRVSFYVLPRNNDDKGDSYGINNIGMLLTDTVIDSVPPGNVIMASPQVVAKDAITQVNYWTPICGIIKAKGGERYITIGNFTQDAETDAVPLENAANPSTAYYMIDYVEVLENDLPQLPSDTVICQEGRIDLRVAGPNISVLWSDETTTSNFIITKPGLYTAEISNGICTFTDSIQVDGVNCEECVTYAPNAFTPNGDGRNDEFIITPICDSDGYLEHYDLRIFDKWGRKVFETQSPDVGWTGKNAEHKGVYTYTLEYRFSSERETKTRIKRGFVTILK